MVKIKKITALILVFLIALPFALSCSANSSDSANKSDSDNPVLADGSNESNIEAIPEITVNIPDVNYNGEEFKILYPNWGLYENYTFADEDIGENMNDSLYKALRDVEERVNVKIVPIVMDKPGGAGINDIYPSIKKAVTAGDSSYDLALAHCIADLGAIVSDNLLYDWNKLPVCDFTKPYWNQSINELLSVKGALYYAANDFLLPDPNAIFFNKTLIQDYELDNPYELVKSGKWTWDKLSDMAKEVSLDLNGDGKFDKEDQYGFSGEQNWMFTSVLHGCDQYIIKKDSDDYPRLDLMTEKTINIIQKMYDLVYTDNRSYMTKYDGNQYLDMTFHTGRILFQMDTLHRAEVYRAYDIDFGILPYPKYDEAQQEYISTNWAGLMCVPINVANPEKTGVVAELLGYEYRKTVFPAYYDVLLSSKLSRDNESVEMLDIIYNNCVYDFGIAFGQFNGMMYLVSTMLDKKSADFVSYYEKNNVAVQKIYDKVYEAILKNMDE